MTGTPHRHGIVVAARALVLHRDHVLLLRARDGEREYYFLPGGGARHGETLADCCAREVLEECGLAIRMVRPLFLREFIAARHRRRPSGMPEHQHALALVFLCELSGPEAALEPASLGRFTPDTGARGVQGLCWVPLVEVSRLELHPPHLARALARPLPEGAVEFWPEE